jgi:prephenate dehydrogenase (NADP+)
MADVLLSSGVAEYLFRSTERLEVAIDCAIGDKTHRSDDTEFVVAARGWSQCVSFGSFDLYRNRFEETASKSRRKTTPQTSDYCCF